MTYSIVDVIKDELRGKAVHVSKDVKQQRLEICSGCPDFKRISRQCGICGCFLDRKALYAQSECPATPPKWLALKES